MPRERTYDTVGHDPDNPGQGVEVSWWPEREGIAGHVQLGTGAFETRDPSVIASREAPDGDDMTQIPQERRFVTLDRAGINRVIRTLRRARDSAYGADA